MQIGDQIPLYMQLFDYNDEKFVRVTVRDQNNDEISGWPVDLELIENGLYFNNELLMPASTYVNAQYIVYDDEEYTEISQSEGGVSESFFLESSSGGSSGPVTSNIIGVIDSDIQNCPQQNGIEDVVVKGSDRTLTIRLVTAENGEPFNLTGTSLLECRFLNDDGTVLSVKSNDAGSPVQIVVAAAGKLTCKLTAAQTLLLMAQNPAAFAIVVTQTVGKIICNLPYQLEIQEKAV